MKKIAILSLIILIFAATAMAQDQPAVQEPLTEIPDSWTGKDIDANFDLFVQDDWQSIDSQSLNTFFSSEKFKTLDLSLVSPDNLKQAAASVPPYRLTEDNYKNLNADQMKNFLTYSQGQFVQTDGVQSGFLKAYGDKIGIALIVDKKGSTAEVVNGVVTLGYGKQKVALNQNIKSATTVLDAAGKGSIDVELIDGTTRSLSGGEFTDISAEGFKITVDGQTKTITTGKNSGLESVDCSSGKCTYSYNFGGQQKSFTTSADKIGLDPFVNSRLSLSYGAKTFLVDARLSDAKSINYDSATDTLALDDFSIKGAQILNTDGSPKAAVTKYSLPGFGAVSGKESISIAAVSPDTLLTGLTVNFKGNAFLPSFSANRLNLEISSQNPAIFNLQAYGTPTQHALGSIIIAGTGEKTHILAIDGKDINLEKRSSYLYVKRIAESVGKSAEDRVTCNDLSTNAKFYTQGRGFARMTLYNDGSTNSIVSSGADLSSCSINGGGSENLKPVVSGSNSVFFTQAGDVYKISAKFPGKSDTLTLDGNNYRGNMAQDILFGTQPSIQSSQFDMVAADQRMSTYKNRIKAYEDCLNTGDCSNVDDYATSTEMRQKILDSTKRLMKELKTDISDANLNFNYQQFTSYANQLKSEGAYVLLDVKSEETGTYQKRAVKLSDLSESQIDKLFIKPDQKYSITFLPSTQLSFNKEITDQMIDTAKPVSSVSTGGYIVMENGDISKKNSKLEEGSAFSLLDDKKKEVMIVRSEGGKLVGYTPIGAEASKTYENNNIFGDIKFLPLQKEIGNEQGSKTKTTPLSQEQIGGGQARQETTVKEPTKVTTAQIGETEKQIKELTTVQDNLRQEMTLISTQSSLLAKKIKSGNSEIQSAYVDYTYGFSQDIGSPESVSVTYPDAPVPVDFQIALDRPSGWYYTINKNNKKEYVYNAGDNFIYLGEEGGARYSEIRQKLTPIINAQYDLLKLQSDYEELQKKRSDAVIDAQNLTEQLDAQKQAYTNYASFQNEKVKNQEIINKIENYRSDPEANPVEVINTLTRDVKDLDTAKSLANEIFSNPDYAYYDSKYSDYYKLSQYVNNPTLEVDYQLILDNVPEDLKTELGKGGTYTLVDENKNKYTCVIPRCNVQTVEDLKRIEKENPLFFRTVINRARGGLLPELTPKYGQLVSY